LSSAHRSRAELGLPSRPTGDELAASEFGRVLRTLPVAALIGSWLFAHSGYIESDSGLASLATIWSLPGNERYRALLEPRSIIAYHDWWKHRRLRTRMKARLADLGLNGLVFGHDPDALGFHDTIAMDPDGWLLKLDTGMKVGRSHGMLLRCDLG